MGVLAYSTVVAVIFTFKTRSDLYPVSFSFFKVKASHLRAIFTFSLRRVVYGARCSTDILLLISILKERGDQLYTRVHYVRRIDASLSSFISYVYRGTMVEWGDAH